MPVELASYLHWVVPLILILLFAVLRGMTQNPLIRKRLRFSLFLLAAALTAGILRSLYPFGPEEPLARKLDTLELVLTVWAGISAGVLLLFNRLKDEIPSDKYPAIVQDTVVIVSAALVVVFWGGEKFIATSAVGALVLGLALQDTLGNLFAGLAIQIEKPFRVGEWIKVAQYEGRVTGVTWRATKIRTKSGVSIVIPNGLISKDTVINYSQPSRLLRVEQTIGLSYDAPPNQVKQVILSSLQDIPEILSQPAPDVLVSEYGDFSIHYRCRFWIDDFGLSEVILDKFATLLYYRLQRAGLKVPFPVRDVRVTEGPQKGALLEAAPDGRVQYVEQVDLFGQLGPEERESIAKALESVTFAAHEPIVRQGEAGDSMFFIRSGQVRIVLESDGTSDPVAILREGDYFGEMALLTGETRSATAFALGDVEAYVLRKDPFRNCLLQDPRIATEISRVMAQRRQFLEEKSAEIAARSQSQKEREIQKNFLSRIQKFFGL